MNPVFYLLVALALIALWFIISTFVFEPLGRVISKKWDKTVEILNKEEQENKTEEKERNYE